LGKERVIQTDGGRAVGEDAAREQGKERQGDRGADNRVVEGTKSDGKGARNHDINEGGLIRVNEGGIQTEHLRGEAGDE
jgi:hypothetical protein